jgi:hypothetical protein
MMNFLQSKLNNLINLITNIGADETNLDTHSYIKTNNILWLCYTSVMFFMF